MSASSQRPTHNPPEGYSIVAEGAIRKGDLVWNDSSYGWEESSGDLLHDEIAAYHSVARKTESAA
jgi:hypothetical protein